MENNMSENSVMASYAEGYNDAYQNGEYLNPYDDLTQAEEFDLYDNGYNDGMAKLVTEAV